MCSANRCGVEWDSINRICGSACPSSESPRPLSSICSSPRHSFKGAQFEELAAERSASVRAPPRGCQSSSRTRRGDPLAGPKPCGLGCCSPQPCRIDQRPPRRLEALKGCAARARGPIGCSWVTRHPQDQDRTLGSILVRLRHYQGPFSGARPPGNLGLLARSSPSTALVHSRDCRL